MEAIQLSPEQTALNAAIDSQGGITAFAKALALATGNADINRGMVHQWRLAGVPAKHCPDIEDLTGVKCESLLPSVSWSVLRKRPKPIKTKPLTA